MANAVFKYILKSIYIN